MKHLIIAIAALISLTASAQSGVDAIAKQRARDAANQNNNRSIDPPAPGGVQARPRTVQPAVAATPLTPAQQAFANFQSRLFAVNTNTAASLKSVLAKDMAEVARGATKPSADTLSKLSDHLTTAFAETKPTLAQKTRLAQNIGVLLNSANTPPAQKEAMVKDVESILQTSGASTENAAAVAADLKTVTEELNPAAK